MLRIPHVANTLEIKDATDSDIILTADMGETVQTLRMPIPALLTLDKDITSPRLPSIRRRYELGDTQLVKILSLDDLDNTNADQYGASGSPTRVERIFPPEASDERVMYTEGDLSKILLDELRWQKVL